MRRSGAEVGCRENYVAKLSEHMHDMCLGTLGIQGDLVKGSVLFMLKFEGL